MTRNTLLSLCLSLICLFTELSACTGFLLKAKNGSIVTGRTVEFNLNLDLSIAITPRNYSFQGQTPNGQGLNYKSKYAAIGAYCFNNPVIIDGVNEKGLVAAAFYFPGYANYTPLTNENQNKALSPLDFPNWILSQFASIEEVKAAIPSVVIVPTVLDHWGPTPPPMHYIVYDKSGNSIVIEPLNETLIVYDNLIGTITNSPTFDWHLTNLINYINLTPNNVNPIQIRGLQLTPFGQGSGMNGLPGDFSPPSRFIRATIFANAALPAENSNQAINQIFHLLNQFDIPLGVVRQMGPTNITYDYTHLSSAKDPNTLKYYYRSYQDPAIKVADLTQFDWNTKSIQSIKVSGQQINLDVSNLIHE